MKRATWSLAAGALVLAACGGGEHEYTGYPIEPAPQVSAVSLPDLAAGGEAFAFAAPADGLLLVYFGYTNCPHECPTTLTDASAVQAELGEQVEVAMVSVDPARDLPVLADYVTGFVPAGHALGTDDQAVLREAADAFGVTYQVQGDQVAHSTQLYAVDDAGRVVMAWTFPTAPADLEADVRALLG